MPGAAESPHNRGPGGFRPPSAPHPRHPPSALRRYDFMARRSSAEFHCLVLPDGSALLLRSRPSGPARVGRRHYSARDAFRSSAPARVQAFGCGDPSPSRSPSHAGRSGGAVWGVVHFLSSGHAAFQARSSVLPRVGSNRARLGSVSGFGGFPSSE